MNGPSGMPGFYAMSSTISDVGEFGTVSPGYIYCGNETAIPSVGIIHDPLSLDRWLCRAHQIVYRSAAGVVTIMPVPWANWQVEVCIGDLVSSYGVILYRDVSPADHDHVRICKYPVASLPTTNPLTTPVEFCSAMELDYRTPRLGATWTANPSPPTLSKDAKYLGWVTTANAVVFDIDSLVPCAVSATACAVSYTLIVPHTATSPAATFRAIAYEPDRAVAIVGVGGDATAAPYDNTAYMAAAIEATFAGGVVTYTYGTGFAFLPFAARVLKLDGAARMAYVTGKSGITGVLTRFPLDSFDSNGLPLLTVCSQNVTDGTIFGVDIVPASLTTVTIYAHAYVFCGMNLRLTATYVRVASCNATTIDDCLADVAYCTWYLYAQACVLRAKAALSICAGSNSTRCTDTLPYMVMVEPFAVPTSGGTLITVWVAPIIWPDASMLCRFSGTYDTPATYSSETTVTCTTPAVGFSGYVVVEVIYLGVSYAYGTPTISVAYYSECEADANCTGRYTGTGTCIYPSCHNYSCILAHTSRGTACTENG
ncbi:MAG: hypothetical protein M0R22_11440, partial [Dehalococcoidia bacterium]|nr:hypothetical protein [Dehalococcoidia bacterium]